MSTRDPHPVAAIGRRLNTFLTRQGLTVSQAAEQIGTSPQVLGNLDAGANVAGKTILRIAAAFPTLNLDWWLYGRGEMYTETDTADAPTRAAILRTTALSLANEVPGKTAVAQQTQAEAWMTLFEEALAERMELLALHVEYQQHIIAHLQTLVARD